MHWLREKPCDVTGALHHTMITVPEEAERFRIQAAKDWETLLLARAKEMASGKLKNTDPVLTNLVPRAFPFKNPPHPFFKEKPWGRGWVLTSPDIFKNRDFFLRSTFRPYVNGVFGYQKRGFSNGLQSGVFVNAGLSFSCGRT